MMFIKTFYNETVLNFHKNEHIGVMIADKQTFQVKL